MAPIEVQCFVTKFWSMMGNTNHLFVIASVKSMSVKKDLYSKYAEDRILSLTSKLQYISDHKIALNIKITT